MRFRRILCPLDFSDCSRAALEAAADLAASSEATLVLAHVYDLPAEMYARGIFAAPELLDSLREDAERRLEAWRSDAVERGAARVEIVAVRGSASYEIIKLARAQPTDLLVMGTHGRTGVGRLLIGSVAERVVRHAPCSVLVVRPSSELRGAAETQ